MPVKNNAHENDTGVGDTRYCLMESDIEAIKYAIFVIESDTGDCFGEDECNGRRCFKHCGKRDCCMLRAKMRLSRILKKAEKRTERSMPEEDDALTELARIMRKYID